MNGPFKTRISTEKGSGKAEKSDKTASKPASRATASERQVAEIGDALQEKAGQLAGLMSGVLPVTSVYMGERSPRAIEALLGIAKKHPKMLLGLQKAAIGIDVLELGQFLVGIAVAIQVDTGRLNGDEVIAQSIGVTAIIDEYFSTEGPGEVFNPAVTVQAPTFAPV
jgi:hypothetical protein